MTAWHAVDDAWLSGRGWHPDIPGHNGPVWGWCPDIDIVLVVRCETFGPAGPDPIEARLRDAEAGRPLRPIWVDCHGEVVCPTHWASLGDPPDPPRRPTPSPHT